MNRGQMELHCTIHPLIFTPKLGPVLTRYPWPCGPCIGSLRCTSVRIGLWREGLSCAIGVDETLFLCRVMGDG